MTEIEKYYEIRDEVSMLLCRMGDIADLYGHTKEYDSLFEELARNLLVLDRMYKIAFGAYNTVN